MRRILLSYLVSILAVTACPEQAQTETAARTGGPAAPDVAALVAAFKEDPRGPYQAIRWFCPDGSVLPPQERCAEPGGIQHALVKDSVRALATEHGVYLGQILAGTPFEEFWAPEEQFGRAKQYALERYLVGTDDGWILRKARYYRGAFQAEDEEAWGSRFLSWLVEDQESVASRFFLVRELARWVPHRGQDDRLLRIRTLAGTIAESEPRFMKLRIKIHSQPDASDLDAVRKFHESNAASLGPETAARLAQLEVDLEADFGATGAEALAIYRGRLAPWPKVAAQLEVTLSAMAPSEAPGPACAGLADLLWLVRSAILAPAGPQSRLTLLDLSLDAERVLFREISGWQPRDLRGLADRANLLVRAAAGSGFLEIWEAETVASELAVGDGEAAVSPADLTRRAALVVRTVEWCTGMANKTFAPAIASFGFEPLAPGFVDACLRSSIVLALGEAAGQLAEVAAVQSGLRCRVMDLQDVGGIRGLNPGYAVGPLEVATDAPEGMTFAADRIYALPHSPADLSPVAGILTVSEGNPVSHVQLLARNLGIPNAVLANRHLAALQPHAGSSVFYAVSPGGTVLMKPAAEMTPQEVQLVTAQQRRNEMVRVPVERIDLSVRRILNLRELRAVDSGRLCGPKAANLGQLKFLFPDQVVEGLVLPFGVFVEHLEQEIPGQDTTYWQWLQDAFARAEAQRRSGVPAPEIEAQTIADLARFRDLIARMPFRPGFVEELETAFPRVLGAELGGVPVFIRSDTNMEDLRDFTGAGLNLTLFNIRVREAVLQGIRDVWASPYSERSYRWRQRYLSNPENVFPSILILPSVNVDRSGVMITTAVSGGSPRDITVAFNRGVAGAVEGQAAESYLLRNDGRDELLSPSREMLYTVLPNDGGTAKRPAALNEPVLGKSERESLRRMGRDLRKKMGKAAGGPLDVELGLLGGRIWLFQVRPFVENRNARGSAYLQALDAAADDEAMIRWGTRLETLRKR